MYSVPGVGNWPPESFNLAPCPFVHWGVEMSATTRGGVGVLADLDGWLEAKLFSVQQLRLQLTTMMTTTSRLKPESESSANSQVVVVGDDDDNGKVLEKNDDDDKDEMNYNVDNVQQQQQQQQGERNNAEDQKMNTVEKVELI